MPYYARFLEARTKSFLDLGLVTQQELADSFKLAKQATIFGFYTSEIGIHKELQYKGNQMLLDFAGCATVDGHDCPHCQQKGAP